MIDTAEIYKMQEWSAAMKCFTGMYYISLYQPSYPYTEENYEIRLRHIRKLFDVIGEKTGVRCKIQLIFGRQDYMGINMSKGEEEQLIFKVPLTSR